ncbi:lytic polysaccharide monooxygenase [Didymella exigua CBS 183.55]|uniref:AA9 family lytic polysaccharide monooxygenase n=1 Tax=Didymella exigua CBS 183.55 TaxID=1150837 RepID=A0A6A5RG54_9PLEO|nr:lytic polysaccharide monooxygenase [Didymella exigua CBS 183.55]KAF1925486.1 lytic polysaccharide monooxygenase [Didymella exigua CBS 183.55]
MFSKAIIATALLGVASAHQNLHQFWVNDETPGYQVGIRMPPSNSPVTDVKSDDMACNVDGSKVPSGVATVPAAEGDSIKVQWDSSGHPGPITHFLYGPVDDAAQATGIGAGWFKIDELDQVDGKWANEIMQAANMTHEFKLPTGLASGEYLLRSEMLALHGAQTVGGAQFYIGCAQLKITGTGSKGACGPTISLPGAYNAEDADIYIPNVYNGFDASTYTAPGGPVATCGGSGNASPAPATSAASNGSAIATPTVSTSSILSSAVATSAVAEGTPVASSAAASAPVATSFAPTSVAAETPVASATTSTPASSGRVLLSCRALL